MMKRLLLILMMCALATPATAQIFRRDIIEVGGGTGDPLNGDGGSTFGFDGSGTFDAKVLFADGTTGAPGIGFKDDTDVGIFRIGADSMGIVTGGVLRAAFSGAGADGDPGIYLDTGNADGEWQIYADSDFLEEFRIRNIDKATDYFVIRPSLGQATFQTDLVTINDPEDAITGLNIGQDEDTLGTISLFGSPTIAGGIVDLYNAGSETGSAQFFRLEADNTILEILAGPTTSMVGFTFDGDLQMLGATDPTITATVAGQDLVLTTDSGEVRIDDLLHVVEGTSPVAIFERSGVNDVQIGLSISGVDFGFIGLAGASTIVFNDNDDVGIGISLPLAKLHVDQLGSAEAIPVLTLDQADVDEDFFGIIGTSDTSVDRALVDAANFTTPGAIVGWLKIVVTDTQGTAPIVDGDYYIPFYAAPTA